MVYHHQSTTIDHLDRLQLKINTLEEQGNHECKKHYDISNVVSFRKNVVKLLVIIATTTSLLPRVCETHEIVRFFEQLTAEIML